jgi:plastocyanin domain-containing protein
MKRIDIEVVEDGFSPEQVTVKAGEPVTLAFTRRVERTCAKEVAIQLGDGTRIERRLPLGETVTIEATFAAGGELRYACPMDMITGVITVE